ncbi:hypothetical protein FHX06_003387 [Rhizobium sp. BK512]|uniref:hypothetical protein n=1 Tax=Rhizobium sp. BK512 TaxID=2587010 RepID=UPI001612E365|nr:hypothetical protein [Rhizobium sp. BK512]MBB3562056.1 hypothetical protein [Rhizobium sp. BK512]
MTIQFPSDGFDVSLPGPVAFEVRVPEHDHTYHIGHFLPYYGAAFCNRFSDAWTKAALFQTAQTSMNYFKSLRSGLIWIAMQGTARKSSPEARVLAAFQSGEMPNERDWGESLNDLAGSISDLDDRSFIDSDNPASRNKKNESLRAALSWLIKQRLFPDVEYEYRRLEVRTAAPSKCIATIAFEAGRLRLTGLNASDARQAFIDFNKKVLEEIRRCLWLELKENSDLFDLGQELMSDPLLPTFGEAEQVLSTLSREEIRKGKSFKKLGLSEPQGLGLALRILRARASGSTLSEKQLGFARSLIDHGAAQPYFEATSKALNAAYHILLIDAGANCQPVDDIPFECFVGKAKRGKYAVRSVRLNKNRKNGEAVPGSIKEDIEETLLYVESKTTAERPSSVVVVDIWKKLTKGMRGATGPTFERLWVWRIVGDTVVKTRLVSMSCERWPAFLDRHSQNPTFGGLPITRQMIRTTVNNSRANSGDLDFVVQQALMGHSSPKVTFEYLTEGAVRALLSDKVRQFVDAWEATEITDLESAARYLGVPSPELHRRAQLGFDNGLSFANPDCAESDESSNAGLDALSPKAKVFRVSSKSLLLLELARRALREQFEYMLNLNPLRLLRTWVPWLAIVEGYCAKIEQTRFKVQLRRARDTVEVKLARGELRLPSLW